MPKIATTFVDATLATAALFSCGLALADAELTDLPGVVASANSCYLSACDVPGTFSAGNAIDNQRYLPGTGGHAWNAGSHGTAGSPNWLRVDLGSLYSLSSVDLRFNDNAGAWQGYTNVYELRSSGDSFQWAGNARPVARWLEYRVVGGSHWSALDEINAMGSPSAVPEPASYALMALGLLAIGLHTRRSA